MRVLLVEDDPRLASDLSRTLQAAGYLVETSGDGEQAWFLGDTEDYGAVILDLGLPAMDGLSVLKRWRGGGRHMPVLILTARASWAERVDGIDAGADDYLPKPFRPEELLARLRALLRRAQSRPQPVVTAGRFRLDEAAKRVTFDGEAIDTSPLEYRLIALLAARKGQIVPAIELANHVQGRDDDTAKNAIEALVTRIRRKTAPDAIQNRRGFGYLIADEEA